MKKQSQISHFGSGSIEYIICYEKRTIGIDFSGNKDNLNFRNDASIFLLMANSYELSAKLLLDKIESCFQDNANHKTIMKYVIPFLFDSRHYIELKLKGLIMYMSKEYTSNTHNISDLLEELSKQIDNLSTKHNNNISSNSCLTTVKNAFDTLSINISHFIEDEASHEYYRYILDTDHQIKNTRILFDYVIYNNLFNEINKDFSIIIKKLHINGIKIFNP